MTTSNSDNSFSQEDQDPGSTGARSRLSPRLLSDSPATTDEFGGGHERIAQAIADLINDESGGKAIALSGPYGSGKSTVVELLRTTLDDQRDAGDTTTQIFTFDAWEHQGDPLRRSFLEDFINFLRDVKWAGGNQWEDEIEKIARRREETETETAPLLTGWGKVVAMLLFIAPLGLILANNFINMPPERLSQYSCVLS